MKEEAGQNLTHRTTEYQTTSRNALNILQLQQSNNYVVASYYEVSTELLPVRNIARL